MALLLALVTITASTSSLAEQHTNIAELRAAYYFNALKFTRWPVEQLDSQSPLNIVLVGSDSVSDILAQKLPDYLIHGHKLSVSSLTAEQANGQSNKDLLDKAHAIYFAENTEDKYPYILGNLKRPVLTGSSIESFANHGGMVEIAYRKQSQKLVFHINTDNLKQSNISISSKLMKISNIVTDHQ
ncbi:hypothetical protein BST96_03950 [Oceanicoccus sagamiensis]|uniref:DUF4154 domain-containing protein n=2 Tax=Oceanicoccus sagamiensis TaxID=716816 RepID=A0A1X9NH65_9GAMM|nr:hypothetical protein BST96_03950 [Oceanicoccus sagamiensis]